MRGDGAGRTAAYARRTEPGFSSSMKRTLGIVHPLSLPTPRKTSSLEQNPQKQNKETLLCPTSSKRARASRGPSPLTIITAVQFRMSAVPLAWSSKLSSSSRLPLRALCMPPRAQAPRRQHLQPLARLLVRAGFICILLCASESLLRLAI